MGKKLNVALVGLGFGGAFAEIYKLHPDVEEIGIFDTDKELTKKVAEHTGINKCYSSYDDILCDKDLDAIHLVTVYP